MMLEHPVYIAVRDYQSRSDPSERLDSLLLAFEFVLRFDALLLASFFVQREDCRDERLPHLLLSRKLQLGEWYGLLQTLIAVLPAEDSSAIKPWFLNLDRKSGGSVFQQLLAIRTRRAHTESRTSKQFVQQSLDEAEHLLDVCLRNHPDWGTLFVGENGRLVCQQSTRAVPCGPFILPGSLAGNPQSVLLYRGVSIHRLSYGAISGEEYASEETYREVIGLLRKKTAVHEIVDAVLAPAVLVDRMIDISRQTVLRLIDFKRYRPDITVTRDEVEAVCYSFATGSLVLFLVDAPAGAGKTTLLCRIVENRLAAGLPTLFETADRIVEPTFPDVFNALLRVRGDITSAFERVGGLSEDERVLIAIDDLGIAGKEETALLSLLQWIEKVPMQTKIRIVVTIRSDRLRTLLGTCEDMFQQKSARRYHIPPLKYQEAISISDKIPIPSEYRPEIVRRNRRDLVNKLFAIPDTSSRRPGLMVPLLESVAEEYLASSFSVYTLYDHLLCQIVETNADGTSRHPLRARILRKLAQSMLTNRRNKASLDDIGMLAVNLIDPKTGDRSADYEFLLANNILVESFENYEFIVTFVDPKLLEFVAAINLTDQDVNESVKSLCQLAKQFPTALSVAAFLIVWMLRSRNFNLERTEIWALVAGIPEFRESLLHEIASFDSAAFLKLFACLIGEDLKTAESISRHLVHSEASLLAEKALSLLTEAVKDNPERLAHFRFLRARALYDLDQYDDAEKELVMIKGTALPAALNLQAEIAVSRGNYDQAKTLYETVLSQGVPLSRLEKGDTLNGLGYALGSLGFYEEAEQKLKEAIEVLTTEGDSVTLAEAYGDLGELFTKGQRYREARECFETNLEICKRIGFLTGTGVAEGLLGYLEMAEGNLGEAEVRLSRALEISRRVHNRWREAWVLDKLSKVAERLGNTEDAQRYFDESQQLFRELGFS